MMNDDWSWCGSVHVLLMPTLFWNLFWCSFPLLWVTNVLRTVIVTHALYKKYIAHIISYRTPLSRGFANKSLPSVPVVSQMNSLHLFTTYLYVTFWYYAPTYATYLLHLRLPMKTFMSLSCPMHTVHSVCHVPCIQFIQSVMFHAYSSFSLSCPMHTVHSLRSLYGSSTASPPQRAIQSYLFQVPLSFIFLKVIQ